MTNRTPHATPNQVPIGTADPRLMDQLLAAAKAGYQSGQFESAEQLCRRLLEIEPRHLAGKALLGLVLGRTGRPEAAMDLLRDVVSQDPNSWAPANALSILLREAGLVEEAIKVRLAANRLKPEDHHGSDELGLCYLALHEFGKAIKCFQSAITMAPQIGPYHTHIGNAFIQARNLVEAEAAYRYALALSPNNVETLTALGELMVQLGNRQEAVGTFRLAGEFSAEPIDRILYQARSLAEDGRITESVELYREASRMRPDSAQIQLTIGSILGRIGRFEESIEHLRRAIELRPASLEAYSFYVSHKKITADDRPILDGMTHLLQNGGIGDANRQEAHFSLGKAFSDLKEFDDAMRHYDEGNQLGEKILRAQFGPFDRERYVRFFDDLIGTFDEKLLAKSRETGCDSELPILIVGMMRTGTTLTEQILSSHHDIGAGGELGFWGERLRDLLEVKRQPLTSELARVWADSCVDLLKGISPGSKMVTDKNPANHLSLGLIRVCLPNARIVHCLRDPVDNCISIYVTKNSSPPPYSFNRANIAFYYKQYARLVEHWRKVLGDHRYIEQRYESLVADKDAAVRRLVAFCGLESGDTVPDHQENERAVTTPSFWQVRQPIYRTSVGRSRNYEPWVADFEELRELEL